MHASPLQLTLPPRWVDLVDEVHEDLNRAREGMKGLQALYAQRLRVTFAGNEEEKEREVENATRQITMILKNAENKIKKIALADNPESLTNEERVLRVNVMRNLGTDLSTLLKNFRQMQKDYIMQRKGQAQVGTDFFQTPATGAAGAGSGEAAFEQALETGFSPEQMEQLDELAQRADQREKEIIQLAQAVNELTSLFSELSFLVVEQGTILDRIDFNIASALTHTVEGRKHLEVAEDYSKRNLTLKCIIVLFLIMVIEIVILVVKHSK